MRKKTHIDSSVFTETRNIKQPQNMKNRIDLPIFLSDNKKSLQMALKQKTTIHYAYYSNQQTHIQWKTIPDYNEVQTVTFGTAFSQLYTTQKRHLSATSYKDCHTT